MIQRPITASALPLLSRCPGQSALEHWPSTSPAAIDGQREHAELLPALIGGPWPESARGRQLREAQVITPHGARMEVSYALDPVALTARELPSNGPRDYSEALPGEIPGTADLSGSDYVGELKTGQYWVDAPRYNAQMWHPAAARFLAGGELVLMHLIQATGQGVPRQSWCRPTASEVLQWVAAMRVIVERVHQAREAIATGSPPPLVLGEHCGRCDVVLQCPAVAAVAPLAAGNPADHYIAAEANYRHAKKKRYFAAVLLGEDERTTTDGRRLVPIAKDKRRVVDAKVALAALPGLARHATPSLTTSAIDAYAETRPDLGRTARERSERITRQLEDAGALTITTTLTHKETDQ